METWVWILVVAIAVVILIALVLWFTKRRERVHEERRVGADELRGEADRRLQEAGRRRAVVRVEEERAAEQRAQASRLMEEAEARTDEAEARLGRAREQEREVDRERLQGEDLARRADEVDPDAPDPDEDFDPEDSIRRRRSESRPDDASHERPPRASRRDEPDYSWQDDEPGDEGQRPGSKRVT